MIATSASLFAHYFRNSRNWKPNTDVYDGRSALRVTVSGWRRWLATGDQADDTVGGEHTSGGIGVASTNARVSIHAEISALGLSCVSPPPQLKRDWSSSPEFGWIPANLCDLSKG